MYQKKIVEMFNDLRNIISITDDISMAYCNEQDKDHDATLDKVLHGMQMGKLEA